MSDNIDNNASNSVPPVAQSNPVIPAPVSSEGDASKNGKAKVGIILGIIGLVAWIIPIIGLPVTVVGLVYSIKGMKSVKRALAITGIVLSSLGLLATIVNASFGAYLAATGQHPFINEIMQKDDKAENKVEGVVLDPIEKTEIIKETVTQIKNEIQVPYAFDEKTTLVNITPETDAIRYYYVLSGIATAEADLVTNEIVKSSLVTGVCTDKDIRYLLESDINVEYVYNIKDYTKEFFVKITKSDCE